MIHYIWITLKIDLKMKHFMLKCEFSLKLPIDLFLLEEGTEMNNNNTIPILNCEQTNILDFRSNNNNTKPIDQLKMLPIAIAI